MTSHRPAPRFRAVILALSCALPIVATAVSPGQAYAQVSRADSAAVLYQTAVEFENDGQVEIAEALYRHLMERYPGTRAAQQARERLTRPPAERSARVSRLELPVFGTMYGLWMGIAVPAAFGADDSEAYGAGLLVGVPLGLLSAIAAQRRYQYTEGQARAITWGGTYGTLQAIGWGEVLDVGQTEFCGPYGCYESDDDESVFRVALVGGLAGIATGALIARNPVRSGVSSAAQGGSIWGGIYSAMFIGMVDPDASGDGPWVATLLSSGAGLFIGEALGSRYDVSRGRVRLMNLGALGGGLAGLGIDLLIQPDGDGTAVGIPLFASIAGLTIATMTTRGHDRFDVGTPGGDVEAALLGYRDGEWSLNAPMPLPTVLDIDRPDGRMERRPGLRFDLFRARFR